jgi:protein ImuB
MPGERALVVWCPDWPVVAAGMSHVAVAVLAANRVVACSAAARAEGVRRGLRRREAQGRCPDLVVIDADPGRDARAFEPVVAAVEAFTPGVEIIRPGAVALATRGPSRYFGGDEALARRVAAAVDDAVAAAAGAAPGGGAAGPAAAAPGGEAAGSPLRCRVGVADGAFAAEQAARRARPGGVTVVPVGESGAFVAPLPVSVLPYPELTGILGRLGLHTLGALAALPARSVLARFGPEGAEAHRLAGGSDARLLVARTPPPDLAVSAELDPPAERVDTAAFVAKSLADELHGRLAARGLVCTRIAIEAETEHGEHLVRLWRHDGALTAGAIGERVRWQLDGWLGRGGTSAGLTLLRLAPDEVRPDGGRQAGFWGGSSVTDDRIARTLARVQGILGPDGVVTGVLGGGRDPAQQVRLVPWGDPREPARPGPPPVAEGADDGHRPLPAGPAVGGGGNNGTRRRRTAARVPAEVPTWPGRLPGPAPAVVHVTPLAAEVRDAAGGDVTVSGRGLVSGEPAEVSVAAGPWQEVLAWAGPWPVEDRWWDGGRRRARFQMVLSGGVAHLLVRESGRWSIEATYD